MVVINGNHEVNLEDVMSDMFLVLTKKEREVLVQRFSLDNKPKKTLESIGQQFAVTRERIRQIEKIALSKLKRTVKSSKISILNDLASEVIREFGGVATDWKLVSSILNKIKSSEDIDANIIRLALNINFEIVKSTKSSAYHTYWRLSDISQSTITSIANTGAKILRKKGDVMKAKKLTQSIRQELGIQISKFSDEMLVSALEVDVRIKSTEEGFGLIKWRHINPRSIRDKAYIILKKAKEPLHFVEIANRIMKAGFDKKVVTTQAVHNELIRYDQFVLVGRGLYALKEFGYAPGTVAEVIEDLLKKHGPMTKKEIMDGVLRQRKVKKGTISLNLQKNPQFVRVGRAVYELEKK